MTNNLKIKHVIIISIALFLLTPVSIHAQLNNENLEKIDNILKSIENNQDNIIQVTENFNQSSSKLQNDILNVLKDNQKIDNSINSTQLEIKVLLEKNHGLQ